MNQPNRHFQFHFRLHKLDNYLEYINDEYDKDDNSNIRKKKEIEKEKEMEIERENEIKNKNNINIGTHL